MSFEELTDEQTKLLEEHGRKLIENTARAYPQAVNLKNPLRNELIESVSKRWKADPLPSTVTFIADFMLEMMWLMSVKLRPDQPFQSDNDLRQESQGYVDAIGLYISMSAWFARQRQFSFVIFPLERHPTFDDLAAETKSQTLRFVEAHQTWAERTFGEKDFYNPEDFMKRLVGLVASEKQSSAYQSGVRVAADTLVAYVALITDLRRLQDLFAGQGARQPLSSSSVLTNGGGTDATWEYQEFQIPLDGREYEASGFPIDGGIPWHDAIEPINRAVLTFVKKVGAQGWEPLEAIDADRLFRARRIEGKSREKSTLLGFGSPNYVWRPREVRMNFRRAVRH